LKKTLWPAKEEKFSDRQADEIRAGKHRFAVKKGGACAICQSKEKKTSVTSSEEGERGGGGKGVF